MERATSFLSEPPVTPDVAAMHASDSADGGYVANYTKVWSWRPELLTAFTKLRGDLLDESSLSPREVAVMVAATASSLGDSYCSLAWGQKLANLSDEETAVGVLLADDQDLSTREAALAAWARQVVRDPNGTTGAGVDELRAAGLAEREIFEATMWIALRLAFSTVNDALGAQPDGELAASVSPAIRDAVTFGRPPSLPGS